MPVPTSEDIRALRQSLGLSQEAFAERLGVSFSTVNRWERGHRVPTKLALNRLAALSAMVFESEPAVAWSEPTRPQLLGVLLRDRVVILDPAVPNLSHPVDTFILESELGPLRSFSEASVRGRAVFLVGARDGVWMVPRPFRNAKPVRFPFGRTGCSKMGTNSTLVLHGHLYATHSERGLIRWNLEHPANAVHLHTNLFQKFNTVRALMPLDTDRILFSVDDCVYVSARGEGEAELLFRDPAGGNITDMVLYEHTLLVATKDGGLYGYDLVLRRVQHLLAHEKAPIHTLDTAWVHNEPQLVIGAKRGKVSLLSLGLSRDRALYSTGGCFVRMAIALQGHIVATDNKCERLMIWKTASPTHPAYTLEVFESMEQHIQDIGSVSHTEALP